MKHFLTTSALAVWLLLLPLVASSGLRGKETKAESQHRDLLDVPNPGQPLLLRADKPGSLGKLDWNQPGNLGPAFQATLVSQLGGTGHEILVEKSASRDDNGRLHVRFQQEVHGLLVEGASIVIHTQADGTIEAINGELVPVDEGHETQIASMIGGYGMSMEANADHVLNQAIEEAGVEPGEWIGDKPTLTVVRRPADGSVCLAWKRLYQYTAPDDEATGMAVHADMIFADATTSTISRPGGIFDGVFRGETSSNEQKADPNEKPEPILCAVHPMIMGSGIPTMETYDCQETFGTDCILVSNRAGPISTGDAALDAAHNNAYITYSYYWDNFARDSMDDEGMPLISRVHFGENYNNAFWDGTKMTYGDGDGEIFIPLSLGLDVVAHELTHGVTSSTSNLIYRGESGALNEAMSDIFSALVEHENGYTDEEVWALGEAIFTPHIDGDALRSLSDPALHGDYDYYPTRYKGSGDNGGVHWNSGIANLAFYLLVNGGTHPRGKTNVVVPPIGYVNAAYIFYHANTHCLTPSSNFYMARVCTAEIFGGLYTEAVHKAWDAVGVPSSPPSILWILDGVQVRNQEADQLEVLRYILGPIERGDRVRCTTSANNGDADLFVRFGLPAEIVPNTSNNACYSYRYGSYESCITGPVQTSVTTVHVAIHAFYSFAYLSLVCDVIPAPFSSGSNDP